MLLKSPLIYKDSPLDSFTEDALRQEVDDRCVTEVQEHFFKHPDVVVAALERCCGPVGGVCAEDLRDLTILNLDSGGPQLVDVIEEMLAGGVNG